MYHKFTLLKFTIQGFLVYSQTHATNTIISFKNISITSVPTSSDSPVFSPPSPAPPIYLLSVDSPTLDISYKQNCICVGCLYVFWCVCWLLSPKDIKYEVFKVHPCCDVYQYFIPFYGQEIFHCIAILYIWFIHLSRSGHLSQLFPLVGCYE